MHKPFDFAATAFVGNNEETRAPKSEAIIFNPVFIFNFSFILFNFN